MSEEDKFCSNCGAKSASAKPVSIKPVKKENTGTVQAVKHVYYDKDGKPMKNPNNKSNTEALMQSMTVVFIAIALIIVTIAGSMFISGNLFEDTFSDKAFAPSVSSTVSEDNTITSSEQPSDPTVSANANASEVSSDEVSSIPEELLAVNFRQKIVGEWKTELPYKNLSMPATFNFDAEGKCTCVIKALFISQKFDGSYTVEDGGRCSITLSGIEEYMNGSNTILGNVKFISDNELKFTADDGTVWNLKRVV